MNFFSNLFQFKCCKVVTLNEKQNEANFADPNTHEDFKRKYPKIISKNDASIFGDQNRNGECFKIQDKDNMISSITRDDANPLLTVKPSENVNRAFHGCRGLYMKIDTAASKSHVLKLHKDTNSKHHQKNWTLSEPSREIQKIMHTLRKNI